MHKVLQKVQKRLKNPIVVNSSWGIISQVLQSVFLSLFFVLIARNYSTEVFASFIIATVLYQLIAAFSSLGLTQWFIREITSKEGKPDVVNKFFKLQIYLGVIFYLINILFSFLLYRERLIHILAILLGVNIVFDNLINAIKCINIAEFKQQKSFIILSIDAFLKLSVACLLIVFPFSVISLSTILIVIRFVTLNLFLKIGSSKLISLKLLLQFEITFKFIKKLLLLNWPFIIIGSISILNWRTATIIISKTLSSIDVANYEISYRIFSLVIMLPIVISTTVLPTFVKLFKEGDLEKLRSFYTKMHLIYSCFGVISFTFIYSYIDFLLPVIFGPNYAGIGIYIKQLFLTVLFFPTAFLQATLLIAMKLEKLDMWLNVISFIINITLCIVGIYFFRSLLVINISILISIIFFHVLQDIILIRQKISTIRRVLMFYISIILVTVLYILTEKVVNIFALFPIYWIVVACFTIFYFKSSGSIVNLNVSE